DRGRRREGRLLQPAAAHGGDPGQGVRMGARECRRTRLSRMDEGGPSPAGAGRGRRHGLHLELPQSAAQAAQGAVPQDDAVQPAPCRVDSATAENLGADLWRVRAVVSNHGYLPTNLSDVAVRNAVAKPVKLSLATGAGSELVMNPASVDLGHLAGRNERKFAWSPWGEQWSPVTKGAEWLVRGKPGTEVT